MANPTLTPDHHGSCSVAENIWLDADMPPATLGNLSLTGDAPLLKSSFHVGIAAQSTIACAALAAAELGMRRNGRTQSVSVDMHAAERECTGYFTIDGTVPSAWAPLSGLYPCKDGHVRIHANFEHHRDGVLRILGLSGDPLSLKKADVQNALASWSATDFEMAAADTGMVASAVRTFSEWDQHPQGIALSTQPLLSFEKLGEAAPLDWDTLPEAAPPLTGIRVLDFTRILAGPVCGRTLAAYGAEVMLVNAPHLPNIEHIVDTSRGKLSTWLDLRQSEDANRLRALLSEAHVFVQGYRPGGLTEKGFSPEEIAAIRPGIVCISLSAYGNEGPWANRRGFDSLVQTATGINHAEGEAFASDQPRPLPVQILDFASGFLMVFAAQAAQLKQREEGGSWHVRISLARTARWLRGLGRVDPSVMGNSQLDLTRHIKSYPCTSGKLMALPHAAVFSRTPATWQRPSAPPGTHPPEWT